MTTQPKHQELPPWDEQYVREQSRLGPYGWQSIERIRKECRERQLLDAQRQLAEKDKAYQTLNNVVIAKCTQVKELYEQLAEKDARVAELEKLLASADEHAEALEQKYEDCPHPEIGPCGCSYDRKSDVCAFHAPAVKALSAKLKAVEGIMQEKQRESCKAWHESHILDAAKKIGQLDLMQEAFYQGWDAFDARIREAIK